MIDRFRGNKLEELDALISIATDLSYTGDYLDEKIWESFILPLEAGAESVGILKTVTLDRPKDFLAEPDMKGYLRNIQAGIQQE